MGRPLGRNKWPGTQSCRHTCDTQVMDHEGLALGKLETIWFDGPTLGPSWLESRGGSRALGNSIGIRCLVPHQAPDGALPRGYPRLLGSRRLLPHSLFTTTLPVKKTARLVFVSWKRWEELRQKDPKPSFSSRCVPALHLFLSIDF